MPHVISEEDAESLAYLDCLLNGKEYGSPDDSTVRIIKAEGEEGILQAEFLQGNATYLYAQEPTNFPGYFPLFGALVFCRRWVRVSRFAAIRDQIDIAEFLSAPVGTEFTVRVTMYCPTYLKWEESLELGFA